MCHCLPVVLQLHIPTQLQCPWPGHCPNLNTERCWCGRMCRAGHYPAFFPGEQGAGSQQPQVQFADVGCGFGGLLVRLSVVYPDTLMLGMELRDKVTLSQSWIWFVDLMLLLFDKVLGQKVHYMMVSSSHMIHLCIRLNRCNGSWVCTIIAVMMCVSHLVSAFTALLTPGCAVTRCDAWLEYGFCCCSNMNCRLSPQHAA